MPDKFLSLGRCSILQVFGVAVGSSLLLSSIATFGAPWQPLAVTFISGAPPLAVSCPGTGTTSSTISCTGTYTGVAPATTGWTYAWNATCSGSGSVTSVASVSGGSITGIVVPTPSSACAGTVTLTSNIPTSATSGSVTIAAPYVGLLDVLSGATGCWSLKACSAAIAAAGTQRLINVVRIVDSHSCDVLVATTGNMGLTANCSTGGDNGQSLASFQTTATTGVGSILGTALTFVGGHQGDAITGGTTAPGTVIVNGSSPNWTVNISQTVTSTTLTARNALWMHTWYDQSGNGHDAINGSNQATTYLSPNADPAGTGYALSHNVISGSTSGVSTTITALSQPYSLSTVAYQIPGSAEGFAVSGYNGASGAGVLGFDDGGVANKAELYCGSRIDVTTATDGVWHAMQGVCNGASSQLSIDSLTSTIANAGAVATSTTVGFGSPSGGTFGMSGFQVEAVVYPLNSTSSISALNSNQHSRWGF